jgi:hypothetical protein
MSIAMTVTDHWSDTKRIHVLGTLTFGGTYPTNGDTPTIAAAEITKIKSPSAPILVEFSGLLGYLYLYNYATNKIKVIVTSTGAELGAGPYPSQPSDVVHFHAIFHKFI